MRTDDDRRRVVVASLGYAMSFARGTRYDSPLRLCRDIKMRVRMPDRLPYVSTIDSSFFPSRRRLPFLTSLRRETF